MFSVSIQFVTSRSVKANGKRQICQGQVRARSHTEEVDWSFYLLSPIYYS